MLPEGRAGDSLKKSSDPETDSNCESESEHDSESESESETKSESPPEMVRLSISSVRAEDSCGDSVQVSIFADGSGCTAFRFSGRVPLHSVKDMLEYYGVAIFAPIALHHRFRENHIPFDASI